jgi:hypothetical protein
VVGVGGRSEDNVGGDQSWVEDLVEEREQQQQQQQQQRQRRASEGMGERGVQSGGRLVTAL